MLHSDLELVLYTFAYFIVGVNTPMNVYLRDSLCQLIL